MEVNGRESRTLPDSKEMSSAVWLGLFLCPLETVSPGPSLGECVHCTWLGFRMRAACGTAACRRLWRMQAGGASGIARSGQGQRLYEFPGPKQRGRKRPESGTLPDSKKKWRCLKMAKSAIRRQRLYLFYCLMNNDRMWSAFLRGPGSC